MGLQVRHPQCPALLTLILCLCVASVDAAFKVETMDRKGNDGHVDAVRVESDWYRIIFDLTLTGSADSIVYKPLDHELRAENYHGCRFPLFRECPRLADPDPVSGLTRRLGRLELVTQARMVATHRILKQTDDEFVIQFEWPNSTAGGQEWMARIINRRRVFLRNDSPAVRVEFEVVNTDADEHSILLDAYNAVSLGRVKSRTFMPVMDGKNGGIDRAEMSSSTFFFGEEPRAAWLGGVNEQGLGAAFSYDWRDVDCMQADSWKTVGAGYGVAMRRRTVGPGEAITFAYTFMPFTGFGTLDGMAGDLAGGILVGGNASYLKEVDEDDLKRTGGAPVKVFLAAGAARRGLNVAISCVRKEDGKVVLEEKRRADINAAGTAVIETRLTIPGDGLHVLTVTADGGLFMEKPIRVGRSRLTYAPTLPGGKKRGIRDAGLGLLPALSHPQYRQLDLSVKTPHVPFLRNHAGGPVRAFFVAVGKDFSPAHVREIVQRADITPEFHAIDKVKTPDYALNTRSIREFLTVFRRSNAEVLVAIGIHWQRGLNKRAVSEIAGRIRDGLGAVVMADVLNEKNQAALCNLLAEGREVTDTTMLPACATDGPKVRLFELANSRVVVIEGRWNHSRDCGRALMRNRWTRCAGTVVPEGKWRGFEYNYAFLGDLIRWAAERESPVTVRSATVDGNAVTVKVHNLRAPEKARCEVIWRSRRWQALGRGVADVDLPSGESVHQVKLDAAPYAGVSALEIHLRDAGGKVMAFGSAGIKVDRGVELAVTTQPKGEFVTREDPGTCRINVTGKVKKGVVATRILDRFDRLLLRREDKVTLENGRASVSFQLDGFRPVDAYHEIVADFRDEDQPDRVLAQASADLILLSLEQPFADRFVIGAHGAPERYPVHIQATLPSARSAGITYHCHTYYDHALYASGGRTAGTAFLTIRNGYPAKGKRAKFDGRKAIMDPPLLPDDERLAAYREVAAKKYRRLFASGMRFIQIDDERVLPAEFDRHPQSLAAFREWLKKRYANIAELNQTWGSDFAAFDDVAPKFRRELGKDPANLAPWLEFRLFMGDVIGEYYMKVPAEIAAGVSPNLHLGEYALYTPSAALPVDWSRYAKYYRTTGAYIHGDDIFADLFRAFSPASLQGRWIGYGMAGLKPRHRCQPWEALLNGCEFIMYWSWVDSHVGYCTMTSDGLPTQAMRTLAREEYADITGGIDRIIITSEFSDDRIAIAYSWPSIVADRRALGVDSKRVLRELGYQVVYRAMDDVAAGTLEKEGIKLLVLPQTGCMSKAQIEGVRRFAEQGGTVLLLGRCGRRNLHGAPHADGLSCDMVADVDTSRAGPLNRTVAAGKDATLSIVALHRNVIPGGDARVTVGAAFDGKPVPILTRRDLGRGRVFWFNSALAGHEVVYLGGVRGEETASKTGPEEIRRSYRGLLDGIAKAAGIAARCRAYEGDAPVFGGRTWYYLSPSKRSLYVARRFPDGFDKPVDVKFARKGHVYDIRTHRYLGHVDSVRELGRVGRVQVYAILDGKVADVTATATKRSVRPGETVTLICSVRLDAGKADLHALRVAVAGPDGRELAAHRQVVLARDGRGKVEIPIALNAAPGQYQVTVRDVISGGTARTGFTLKP